MTLHDTEQQVCRDIMDRQQRGVAKYGVTVATNPLPLRDWLQHAYEECLDQAVYLKRAMQELHSQNYNKRKRVSKVTHYAWSRDGEEFHGRFVSIADAIEAAEESGCILPWIGECYTPGAEEYIDADLVLEHIACQDEYCTEWADDWPGATELQREELTNELRTLVGGWLDRNGLRDGYYLIRNKKRYANGEVIDE